MCDDRSKGQTSRLFDTDTPQVGHQHVHKLARVNVAPACASVGPRLYFTLQWLVSISHHTGLLSLHNAWVRHLSTVLSRTQPCSRTYSQLQEHSSHFYISCSSNLVRCIFSRNSPVFELFNNSDHVRGHTADKSHGFISPSCGVRYGYRLQS